jgi:hypothetical protein
MVGKDNDGDGVKGRSCPNLSHDITKQANRQRISEDRNSILCHDGEEACATGQVRTTVVRHAEAPSVGGLRFADPPYKSVPTRKAYALLV